MLTTIENEAKTRRYYEAVWNERRLELIDDWVAPDFVGHYSSLPEPVVGVAGFRAFVDELLTALPDARMTVLDAVAADDKVVSRIELSGTQTGELLGYAPTGLSVRIQYIAIERYVDGLCVEEWVASDDLGLARQIHAVPAAGSRAERLGMGVHRVGARRLRRRTRS